MSLLITIQFSPHISAADNQNIKYNAYITNYLTMRKAPGTWNDAIGKIWQCAVEIIAEENDSDGDLWYKIKTPYGTEGYVYSYYVKKYESSYDKNFIDTLNKFPDSYRAQLVGLHKLYPNWKFVPDKVNITLKNATDCEEGRKLISTYFNPIDSSWIANTGITKKEPGYEYASKNAIKYFLSPENFLTPQEIFMFMPQSLNSSIDDTNAIKSIVKDTFLDRDDYIKYIKNASVESKVNALVLAGTILLEQGRNGSALSSGTYPGFEGYYNFFNFAASGNTKTEIIISGLTYAKNNNWNSPEKAIIEGAKKYSSGYIQNGQDTYFYKDFNVINKVWWKQYATSIHDAAGNASVLSTELIKNQDAELTFKIPVYDDAVITPIQKEPDAPEHSHVFSQVWQKDSNSHWLICSCGATSNKSSHTFDGGVVKVQPTTQSQGIKVYTCSVCSFTKEETIPKIGIVGDINGDGKLNSVDAAIMRLYFLDLKKLSQEELSRADVNKDGKVDSIDSARMRLHFLEIKLLN